MSNGRPFRPTNHPRAGYAKSGAFQGPMGRARLATMQARGRHKDPAPWDTGTRIVDDRTAVLRRGEVAHHQRSSWPRRLAAHALLPRAERRSLRLGEAG